MRRSMVDEELASPVNTIGFAYGYGEISASADSERSVEVREAIVTVTLGVFREECFNGSIFDLDLLVCFFFKIGGSE